MRVGVVVNPRAGRGADAELVRSVVERLRPERVLAGQDDLGARYLDSSEIIEVERTFDRHDTVRLVKAMDGLVDVIVVFGGDGTMSDAASAFPETPLLCIGTGTTNVSPLLCPPDFDPSTLVEVPFSGLYVRGFDRVAFNDVVAGPTILATVDGKIREVDALAYMHGEVKPGNPSKFYARVSAEGRTLEGVYGNIFISMLDSRYLGKGISGGASISAFVGFSCLIACLSHTVVVGSMSKESLRSIEPIKTETLSFDSSAKMYAETVISADGNPFTHSQEVEVVYKKDVVRVLKPRRP
ncbi:diacylglycerol/lipid kinase family protein [Geoglobus ahangari]